MNLSEITGLYETSSTKEANDLLKDGWTVYDIDKRNGRYTFLLVKL